jgi:spore coat protein H
MIHRTLGIVAALLLAATCAIAAEGKAPKPVPGADIFARPVVLPLTIEFSTNELKALQKDQRHYVRATVREGSNVWNDVGVHLKGAAGSFRGIEDKPALTVHFSKFTPDQKFHGLKKIHLNNSVQDASYLTETLCGDLFRQAGVPAARACYATLVLNGRKKGVYVLKEGFEKEMLGLYFKKTKGNLYDGGFLREITDPLERDGGEGDDVDKWQDLKALASAAQSTNVLTRFDELSKVLDVDRFIAFTAMEVMTWDWDGYVMNRNNYRVFHDLGSGKMVFFPHGMDQMFWQAEGPIYPNMNGLVAQAALKTPQGRLLYRERFEQIFTNVFRLEFMTNRVNELANVARAALTNHHGVNFGNDYDNQVKRIRDLITARHAFLAKKLAEPEPQPLKFENGIARLAGWEIPQNIAEQGNAKRDKAAIDSKQALHIQTAALTSASWRTRALLAAGKYRFEASAKTAGVVPFADPQKGEGAGIRISGSQSPRTNKLSGDAAWQPLAYEFDVAVPTEEVQLVCELRASKGEVWFDAESLKLVKVK